MKQSPTWFDVYFVNVNCFKFLWPFQNVRTLIIFKGLATNYMSGLEKISSGVPALNYKTMQLKYFEFVIKIHVHWIHNMFIFIFQMNPCLPTRFVACTNFRNASKTNFESQIWPMEKRRFLHDHSWSIIFIKK